MSINTLQKSLSWLYGTRRWVNSEEKFIHRSLKQYAPKGGRLLDVGCGFAKYYASIQSTEIHYTGVEINPELVQWNKKRERRVFLPQDLPTDEPLFDVLLFSHIIEHFSHEKLVGFINPYLRRLPVHGHIIFLTPFMHRGFYDDFDHVKPYNPASLRVAFCHANPQIQGFGIAGKYRERKIWFRRDPLWHRHRNALWQHAFATTSLFIYLLSLSVVGSLTGYGMVLEKTGELHV